VSGHIHAPAALSSEKNTGAHLIGVRVGPRGDMDDLEKRKNASLAGFQTPHSPARRLVTIIDYAIPASRSKGLKR
jgi:hypothetical protein